MLKVPTACVYCGRAALAGRYACEDHYDLPASDPYFVSSGRRLLASPTLKLELPRNSGEVAAIDGLTTLERQGQAVR